jgi:serine phosphatase RsbU (regulator of sigma subunit)
VQKLKPGQALVMFTDGVTEAISPQNNFFGLNKLKDFINSHCSQKLSEMCQAIYQKIGKFQHGNQFDDITILALKRER